MKKQEYVRHLTNLAKLLNISYYRVRKIRDQIAGQYPGVPHFMIFGTKGYYVESFRNMIK